jgi:cold shock CspA family protein
MIKDLEREGRLPGLAGKTLGFSATCELRESSSCVDDNVVIFKAVNSGPNTEGFVWQAIPGNIPWQYSTSFFKNEDLEEYLWERRKEQIEWESRLEGQMDEYLSKCKTMIYALQKTYPGYSEKIISEKLGVHIDDITQTLDSLRLQGGGGQRLKGRAKRWNPRGFGFIAPLAGDRDVFCRFSDITDGNMLCEGEIIEYERGKYDSVHGNYRAANVTGGRTGQRGGHNERRGGGGRGGSSCEYAVRRTPPIVHLCLSQLYVRVLTFPGGRRR